MNICIQIHFCSCITRDIIKKRKMHKTCELKLNILSFVFYYSCVPLMSVTFQNIKIFQNSPNAITTQRCFKMPMGW